MVVHNDVFRARVERGLEAGGRGGDAERRGGRRRGQQRGRQGTGREHGQLALLAAAAATPGFFLLGSRDGRRADWADGEAACGLTRRAPLRLARAGLTAPRWLG